MTIRLDVNVLIALIDPAHVSHDDAHAWFGRHASAGWATCPLTENGVIRVVGNPRYPNNPGPPAGVAAVVTRLRALPGHVFWTDDISLLAEAHIDFAKILTSAQVTDTFLLGLAVAHAGRLATFDRRLSVGAVRGGKAARLLLPER